MEGSDKNTDPSLMTFGGYGSSISSPKLRIVEDVDFWKQCKKVRRKIAKEFFPSMRRMKLMNWIHCSPRIWNYLEKRTDLGKITRTYSVELANLGAWDHPCATTDAPETDTRARCSWFTGSLNNSFSGARAVFALGVITLGTDISMTITYNMASVTETDADSFADAFKRGLERLLVGGTKGIKIGQLFEKK
jgi:hypothetical protein